MSPSRCTSARASLQEAAAEAATALATHLGGLAEDRLPLPEPLSPDAPLPDWLAGTEERARVLVPAERPHRSVRVNNTVDEALLARLDAAASASGETRPGFIAGAVRSVLRGRASYSS